MTRLLCRTVLPAGLVAAGGMAALLLGMQTRPAEVPYRFNAAGELIRPEGYREWIFVGTPLTPDDMNRGNAAFPEFHSVYIDPGSWEHWKRTGRFPDGTILMKELISVGSKAAASGKGYFMGDFIGLEATIKSEARFPDEPGHWAYFSFTDQGGPLLDTSAAFPAADCNACHDANADDDWVFTQYYPVLRAGKPGGARPAPAPETRPAEGGAANRAEDIRVPTNPDDLFEFLTAGRYKSWAHESQLREVPTRVPHPDYVVTYLNAALDDSMKAGNDSHPAGSAAVKEMYDEGRELLGWAVSVKTDADSDRGRNWYWYETISTTDPSDIVVEGMGAQLCVRCHARGGVDNVRIPYPLP